MVVHPELAPAGCQFCFSLCITVNVSARATSGREMVQVDPSSLTTGPEIQAGNSDGGATSRPFPGLAPNFLALRVGFFSFKTAFRTDPVEMCELRSHSS